MLSLHSVPFRRLAPSSCNHLLPFNPKKEEFGKREGRKGGNLFNCHEREAAIQKVDDATCQDDNLAERRGRKKEEALDCTIHPIWVTIP